ncbi:MAG: serine--tRNA ligase, partial [bacterium]|nr:serine--tRNA ligase [bacterium]
MLDIELLRKSPDKVKEGIAAKKADPALVDQFLAADNAWRAATTAVEELRAKQNKFSFRVDPRLDPCLPAGRRVLSAGVKEEAKKNKELIKAKEEEVAKFEAERDVIWMKIPNVPDDDVPRGNDESGNVVLKSIGEPRDFKTEGLEPKDHLALGEALGLIDVERAGKVTGTRFAYIKGELARMEFALVQMVLDTLTNPTIMRSIVRG